MKNWFIIYSNALEILLDPLCIKNRYNKNFLCFSASRNSGPLKLLLQMRVFDINYRDNFGKTALYAFSETYPDLESIPCINACLLLEHGIKFDGDNPQLRIDCTEGKACPLVKYFSKLQLLGYKLRDSSMRTLFEARQRLFDETEPEYSAYLAELEVLKTITICRLPRRSLYDILFLRKFEKTKLAKNKILHQFFLKTQNNFENEFPHYGFILNRIYEEIFRRRNLLISSLDKFYEVTAAGVSEEIFENICQYLSQIELKMLSSVQIVELTE